MPSLDLTEAKADKFDKLEDGALGMMQDVIDGNRDMDDVAKGAMKILNVVAKNRQTLTAREASRFHMACAISDETALKKYVNATQPQIKKLTGTKTQEDMDA